MNRQEIGAKFEREFAEELGLKRVPGSGNRWHSKLDARGKGALWSLKATASARMSGEEFIEVLEATFGPGGDGRLPLMAMRFFAETDRELDLVTMRKDDFLAIVSGEYVLAQESRTDAKRRLAATPELLREV